MIPDVAATIVETVNEVRARFTYVFTTGGIGPTHDDITSECIAAAFGVPWEKQPEAWALHGGGAIRRASSTPRGSAWRRCRAARR